MYEYTLFYTVLCPTKGYHGRTTTVVAFDDEDAWTQIANAHGSSTWERGAVVSKQQLTLRAA